MDIEVGDLVTIRFSPRGSESNHIYKIEQKKTNSPSGGSYWVMSRNNDLLVFDTPIIIKKTIAAP